MWKNTAKTVVLLSALGGLLVGFGALFGGRIGIVLGLGLGLVVVGASYWFSDRLALRAARARPLPVQEHPWLHTTLADIASRAGIPVPALYVSPSPQPNAFATGRNERHAVVCVTEGLLATLDRSQVTGVLAHELAHAAHRDILIGSVAAAIGTGISAIANIALFAGMFGGSDEDSNPFAVLLAAMLAPIAATLLQLAVSRSREFEADRRGAELVGDPRPLASALASLHQTSLRVPMDVPPAQSSAWIVNPLAGRPRDGRKAKDFSSLFQTHPPVGERIERLLSMAPTAVQ